MLTEVNFSVTIKYLVYHRCDVRVGLSYFFLFFGVIKRYKRKIQNTVVLQKLLYTKFCITFRWTWWYRVIKFMLYYVLHLESLFVLEMIFFTFLNCCSIAYILLSLLRNIQTYDFCPLTFSKVKTIPQAAHGEVLIKPDHATTHTLISDGNGLSVSATVPWDSCPKT